ncbi:SDR family NAD(P)-dependent oxidoreductase [Candidatus Zixiibacteriota bacterium]
MIDQHQRVAVIAGGIRNLATSIAQQLTREGFDLAIIDQDRKSMLHIATKIGRESGRNILTIMADITVEGQLSAALSRAVQQFGKLDLIIVYADMESNQVSFPLCEKYANSVMEEQGSGVIIQIEPQSGRIVRYCNSGDPGQERIDFPTDQVLTDTVACEMIIKLVDIQ